MRVIREAKELVALPVVRRSAKTSLICHRAKTNSVVHSNSQFEGPVAGEGNVRHHIRLDDCDGTVA